MIVTTDCKHWERDKFSNNKQNYFVCLVESYICIQTPSLPHLSMVMPDFGAPNFA